MGLCLLSLVILSFPIVLIPSPTKAEKLWGIYEKDEQVNFIFETSRIWDQRNLNNNAMRLADRLQLKQAFAFEPMFPKAPAPKEIEERYKFHPKYDLRSFYILKMSVSEASLRTYISPFGFAARVQKQYFSDGDVLRMKSIEPDLPLSAYSPMSSSNCPDEEAAPVDRAWSLRNMRVPEAWAVSIRNDCSAKGFGEKIGHPDTGYSEHVDLDTAALEKDPANNFIEEGEEPEDPLKPDWTGLKHPGHGTATGSVIISRGEVTTSVPEGSQGGTKEPGKVTGVATKAELVPYRSIESVIRFTYGNIEKAIYKAVDDNCSVISLSLGGVNHRALDAAMEYAIGRNVIVVAAAGNSARLPVVYPASYPFCIAAVANNIDDKPWESSAHGKAVTISAPGEAVWRALRSKPDEDVTKVGPSCGTSYSTANVAGVAALWLAHYKRDRLISRFHPNTRLQFVFKTLLQKTARRPEYWDSQEYGSGIVDAERLLLENPENVSRQAIDDYRRFTKEVKASADSNLAEMEKMYERMSSEWRGSM